MCLIKVLAKYMVFGFELSRENELPVQISGVSYQKWLNKSSFSSVSELKGP